MGGAMRLQEHASRVWYRGYATMVYYRGLLQGCTVGVSTGVYFRGVLCNRAMCNRGVQQVCPTGRCHSGVPTGVSYTGHTFPLQVVVPSCS